MTKDWQVKYQCNLCDDIIWSAFSGEYKECKCGAIAVDQTPYYTRRIGESQNFKEVNEQNRTD